VQCIPNTGMRSNGAVCGLYRMRRSTRIGPYDGRQVRQAAACLGTILDSRRLGSAGGLSPPGSRSLPRIAQRGAMQIASVRERLKSIRRTKGFDLFAAAPLIVWYGFCAAQMLPVIGQQIALIKLFIRTDASVLPAALVLSTLAHVITLAFFGSLVVMFAVRHVPQRTTSGFAPRLAALVGTFLSFGIVLLPLQELSTMLYLASLLLIIAGTGVAIFSVLVLGRSISILPEARRLVTSGPYAIVRHPLYLGEILAVAGVALQYLSAWSLLLWVLICTFQIQRMKYEERVLSEVFPQYADYEARTPRLLPSVY
jgi:protein-S-isoprenylcysteine O-methyltransferase Ste14